MKPFEEIKQEILKRAKEAKACDSQYKRAYASKTTEELLNIVKDNLRWAYNRMGVNAEFLEEYFGVEILKVNHIYTSGINSVKINDGEVNIWTLGNSNAKVETWGNSNAKVETWGNSNAQVETWDNSNAQVETLDNSNATFEVKGENSFILYRNERKIYVKKNNFEIVEVE